MDPSSQVAFQAWLQDNGQQQEAYQNFQAFLRSNGAGNIVPAWQLLRVDANYASRCGGAFFNMPPREKWSAIVPTLKFVRDEVIPKIGSVAVVSSWRSDEINTCVKGASRSQHKRFTALDLVALDQSDKSHLFKLLCELHRDVGQRTKMGLGAYFDPTNPLKSSRGRFHVDVSGFRTWGYDYSGSSSPCTALLAN